MCIAGCQHKNVPVAITVGEQNNSTFKHTTCTRENGQLDRNTQYYSKMNKDGEHQPKLHIDGNIETKSNKMLQ
jgi:hypothetical protein